MKKIIAIGITAAFLAGMSASAIPVTVTIVSGDYQFGSGGEFNVSPVIGAGYTTGPNGTLVNNGFETFCFDRNPSITVPGNYNATLNGSGVDAFGLHLSVGVAWLYEQFATGNLAGYNYVPGAGRAASAYNLQLAIWNLEGLYGAPGTLVGNTFLNEAISQFVNVAGATAFTTGNAYDVGILDLATANGDNVQPMLVLLPDGGSALILLGMSLSGMAVIARKFRA